jgi:hypothetical protein
MTNRIIRGYSWLGIAVAILLVLYGALVTVNMAGDPDADIGYILGVTGLLALTAWGLCRVLGWALAGFYARFWPERPGDKRAS